VVYATGPVLLPARHQSAHPRAAVRHAGITWALAASLCSSTGLFTGGCTAQASQNARPDAAGSQTASFELRTPRGRKDVLVILALSGRGSRAAYWSTAVMFRLRKAFPGIDLLKEVDAISAVSGGSLPAAYYAASKDPDQSLSVEVPCPPAAPLPLQTFVYDGNRRQLTVYGALTDSDAAALRRAFPGAPEFTAWIEHASRANADARLVWDEARVKQQMQTNFMGQWLVRWFYPWNVFRYWFTSYSRTDIMAGIFARDLFDAGVFGRGLVFGDLNPERPALILNATDATGRPEADGQAFDTFTFTAEDFQRKQLSPALDAFPLARGVMTSAAFPGLFNYVNLQQGAPEPGYAHLFDGGNADNLGLTSADRVIWQNWKNERNISRIAVIIVDAYTAPRGVPAATKDPRWPWGYIIDTNFLDTYDALLTANRKNMLAWFDGKLKTTYGTKDPVFCHLTWEPDDSPEPPQTHDTKIEALRPQLNRIATNFTLAADEAQTLDQAALLLVSEDNECLRRIAAMFQ